MLSSETDLKQEKNDEGKIKLYQIIAKTKQYLTVTFDHKKKDILRRLRMCAGLETEVFQHDESKTDPECSSDDNLPCPISEIYDSTLRQNVNKDRSNWIICCMDRYFEKYYESLNKPYNGLFKSFCVEYNI